MWRQNILRQNPDSDQSISDEEDEEELDDHVCLDNVVSLDASVSAKNKEELPLLVRLDFLKGICNKNLAGKDSSSSFEKPIGISLEDEVEMPDFKEGDFSNITGEVVANSSDEEIISEDEGNAIFSARKFHKHGPQFIRNEQVRNKNEMSEALLRSKESASCSASHATCSKADRSGIWSKANPRFLLPSLSLKCGHIDPSISNFDDTVLSKSHRLPEIMETVDRGASANLDGNYLEDDDIMEKNSDTEPDETGAYVNGFNLPSMADLFDNLQDKTNMLGENFRNASLYVQYLPRDTQRRGKKVQLFQKRSTSPFEDTIVDNEDSSEPVGSGSSSDTEVSDQHLKITFPGKKTQTMADRFQEALGASCVLDDGTHVASLNSSRAGIFGNLQRVMQKEKDRDMGFWKKLQAGAMPDDSEVGCVDVTIISRYLDGKLIVCHCSFGKYTEKLLLPDNSKGMGFSGGEISIIFSPRVCDNIDLEVGNIIRIHPPCLDSWTGRKFKWEMIKLSCAHILPKFHPKVDSLSRRRLSTGSVRQFSFIENDFLI